MMKKRVLLTAISLLFCLGIFTGCDPIYPPGKLKVAKIETLSQGTTVGIEIIYPNTGGSIVLGWKDQNAEIINGNDIVAVSGLSITGLKPGTSLIKVNATTIISNEANTAGHKEKVYSAEIEIKVK